MSGHLIRHNYHAGGYAEGKVGQLPTVMSTPPRADWVNPTGKAMGNFIVAVDPQGQLAYSGLSIEKRAAHVIEALTEQVAPEYLSYLQNQGFPICLPARND